MNQLKFVKQFKLLYKNPKSTALFFKDLKINDIFNVEFNLTRIGEKQGYNYHGYYQPEIIVSCGDLKHIFTINQFLLRFDNITVEEIYKFNYSNN